MNPDPLAQLRGYHLPDPVGWWPPAPGWWLSAALLLVLLVALIVWIRRRRRRDAPKRAARAELARLKAAYAANGNGHALADGLSRLLRRYALARFPGEAVGGLTGQRWLAFLDRQSGGDAFRSECGKALIEAPYRPDAPIEAEALIGLVHRWLDTAAEKGPKS